MKPRRAPSNAAAAPSAPGSSLPQSDPHPPQLFVLPQSNGDSHSSLLTLEHPRSRQPTRYLLSGDKHVLEITANSPQPSRLRSWLVEPQSNAGPSSTSTDQASTSPDQKVSGNGYIFQDSPLMLATPIDPLFLLLPALSPHNKQRASSDRPTDLFLSIEDLVERLSAAKELGQIYRNGNALQELERRLASACDVVEAGDDRMFRLNVAKLTRELVAKASRMIQRGLPPSMEAHFVERPLRPATISIAAVTTETEAEVSGKSDTDIPEGLSQASQPTSDSQTLVSTLESTSTATEVDAAESEKEASPEIKRLLRLRTALNMTFQRYIPRHLEEQVRAHMLGLKSAELDFTPLDEHLGYLAQIRDEARAARAAEAEDSRKRALEDAEADEERAARRQKLEDEERQRKEKTKAQSRGLKALGKADTTGMKKMSDFFARKAVK